MTQLLEQAIAELWKLPATSQDAIASTILALIADENLWNESFATSQEQLAQLAHKVREDIRADRLQDKGMDEL